MVNRRVTQPFILWGCTSIHQTNRKDVYGLDPVAHSSSSAKRSHREGVFKTRCFNFVKAICTSTARASSVVPPANSSMLLTTTMTWAAGLSVSQHQSPPTVPHFPPENCPPGLVQPHSPRSGNDPFGWLLPRGPRGLSSFHLRRLWCPG